MITKEEFLDFINNYQSFEAAIDKIDRFVFENSYQTFWESSWCEAVGKMLDIFLKSHFTDDGCDIINFQLFEADEDGQKITEKEDNKEITYYLRTMEDVWNYITDDARINFYVKSY